MLQYRFSHHANRALLHAQTLAAGFQHPAQETGHLLVGVILAEGSIGADILRDLDLSAPVAGVFLKRLMERLDPPLAQPPRSAAFEQALHQSAEESDWLGQHYIGTEHLLLGITRNNLGNAVDLLRLLDVTPEQIRRRVRRAIGDGRHEFSLETIRANARLSELSRRVLNAAEQSAIAQSHPLLGIGHVLLALAQERRGACASLLQQSGLNLNLLRSHLAHQHSTLMISIEGLLEEAVNQAEKLGSHYVGADHLLLTFSFLHVGVNALNACEANPDKLHRLLDKTFHPPQTVPQTPPDDSTP